MTRRSATIDSLTPGTWYFAVRAVNSAQKESVNSNVTSKVITGATAARTVGITISAPTPVPPPPSTTPSLKTVETTVYEVLLSGRDYVLGNVVGRIALEKPCSASFIVGYYTHYSVARTDVTFSQTSRSNVVVARCTSH